ncbi:exo-alpha-sialidase [Parapedobacter sp. ISTM3]|uniref:sialidase family protein n=1 Tax=Parapedobacter sp. ISTM3 TaxID=2800130 RepID=UPI001908EA2B|nr:sialidase family protein [Parapedobacter sp. ISTM3]MBK1439077.1 exo-alpha-sialidase [Parapedobacter sp. ISTM3]
MNCKSVLVKCIGTAVAILSFIVYFNVASRAQGNQINVEERAEPAMETPIVNTNPLPTYGYDRLDYGMTIGIERTPNGRIWACWVGGGDNEDAFFVLNTSDDNGQTWSEPRVVIDPHDPSLSDARRTIVGNLWTDPQGNLWLFFDQSMTYFDGRAGLWYTVCENPDSDEPRWSAPKRLWHGCALNKPVVLSDGTWMLPVSLWDRGKIKDEVYKRAFPELDTFRMANVFVSNDRGQTWQRRGGVRFPKPKFDEHQVIERRDGTLWMTARTGDGIWQSVSSDKGRTWSAPQRYMPHISSRHFIRRLQSGRLLMVRHGALDERTAFRSKLIAYLSEDDGKSWKGGLMIDERRGVSYPDGFQASDGTIYIAYDRNRELDGEILMARFTEADILEGRFQSPESGSRILISRPRGLDKLPPPSGSVASDISNK